MRSDRQEIIRLDKCGLIALFIVLVVALAAAVVYASRILGTEETRVFVNIPAESDEGVIPYEIFNARPLNGEKLTGMEADIRLPCGIGRSELIATVKEALLKIHASHKSDQCQKVNVYLGNFREQECPAVAEGYLCKTGRRSGSSHLPPWTIQTSLVSFEEWPEMNAEARDNLCAELAKAGSCPWSDSATESAETQKLRDQLSIPDSEAKSLHDKAKKLTSASFNYRQELR